MDNIKVYGQQEITAQRKEEGCNLSTVEKEVHDEA